MTESDKNTIVEDLRETKGTCGDCKWWKEGRLMPKVLDFQPTVVGSCKRMPHTETKVEDDWCGEFQPR